MRWRADRHVAIEPIPPEASPIAAGFVIRAKGMEQLSAATRVAFIPSEHFFYFDTIDQARDFCWACGFTWSIRCG
jgi:hypothetical protein